ncbi:beta-galactosidase [Salana multivorans]|uniref:Beta-galactosidase n=1 Tax=Salana multivorans TaxID=120377 RepID=A0A3N2D117_9MICO|nr:beta-galactosidase [Salana multivorans]ROR93470.1 beta-galactosidase [Salana multivorans]
MTALTLRDRQILADGEPTIVVAGEVHYFRLHPRDWESRLCLLREAGADTVATYVPWVVHERGDGTIDLVGRTDPSLDLGGFVDLAADRGLRVLLRPGPFIMAETAGEGVPDRVRREHPEVVPLGWHGRPVPTAELDYLAPAFLGEVRRWYDAVGAVAAPRMAPAGGPVAAVQLDNEVGMLAWVSNAPHLDDRSLAELRDWLEARHGDRLARRYPGLADASTAESLASFAASIRSPRPEWAQRLRIDLGRFARGRLARYVDLLAGYAREAGMGGVPFLVNVHGTAERSGAPFPVGISQLVETYAGKPGFAAGSDHYLGDLDLPRAADLHLMNACLTAVNGPDQPTTALELEAGAGDYADDLAHATDPSAVVLKTRLSLAQGNRLLNYYLFAGGTNGVADPPRSDGTTRFGITGERHGFSAPVDPERGRSRHFASQAEAMSLAARLRPWIADAREEHDDLAIGLHLDHYLTEYVPPRTGPAEDVAELEYARGAGPRGLVGRVLLTLGYRYGAVDLQTSGDLPRLVVLGTPRAVARDVQELLARHVLDGGSLLMLGHLPVTDLDGEACTVLADALGIAATGEVVDRPDWFTSVTSTWGRATERRVSRAETYAAPGAEVFLREAIGGEPTGLLVRAGRGTAVLVGCDYGVDLELFRTVLTRLGVAPGLAREPHPGLVTTTTRAADGSRLLHVLNVSGFALRSAFELDGTRLFDGAEIEVPARSGLALPIGVRVAGRELAATSEVLGVDGGRVRLAAPGRAWLDGAEVDAADGAVAL